MENPMILHTHTLMALLLALLNGLMSVYLWRLKDKTIDKKWFLTFYLCNGIWQIGDMIRYSLNPKLFGGFVYKTTVLGLTIPALCILFIAWVQFLFLFLDDTFPKARKIVLKVMVFFALIVFGISIWNEFYNHSDRNILELLGFVYGFFADLCAVVLCFRKSFLLRKIKPEQARGTYYMGWINVLFVAVSVIVLIFGFFSPIGYWSFFVLIWVGNLSEIVVFINYAAVPTNFQTKLIGFTFVIVMSVLMLVTLVFYPPLPPNEIFISITQQLGFIKLFAIILLSFAAIQLILPYVLKKTLTNPLQRLLIGVQQVNSGDLTTKVQVGHADEIGDLTQNFNRMTETIKKAQDDLKNHAENLELQVTERTSEIKKQNRQIEIQRDDLQKSLAELKSTQNQLVQKEKLASLGELTAGIAHEIQNPLNFVNNFSELSGDLVKDLHEEITKETVDKNYIKELMHDLTTNQQKINHHGKRASSIVKGMLEHSRASTGVREMTDINKLADEYLRLSYHGLRAKDKNFNADYQTDFDENLPKINIVPQDIGRVLLNLINNAFWAVNERAKNVGATLAVAIDEHGQSQPASEGQPRGLPVQEKNYTPLVIVSTKKIGDAIEITVRDNGNGIPKQNLEKVFQPFFTTKPTGQGTGLGLSLAYDIIIKGHSGELKVYSEEGIGSEFKIVLPIK